MVDDKKIEEIIGRGNTAEVKKTKKGVIILEVSRKIRYENNEEEEKPQTNAQGRNIGDQSKAVDAILP
jgi:hypothetical protein